MHRPARDLRPCQPVGCQQHDPGPLGDPGLGAPVPGPPLQLDPVGIGDRQNAHAIRHKTLSRYPELRLKRNTRQTTRQQQQSGRGDRGQSEDRPIGGATVLTNANGFTLYSFAPDTPAKSNCDGSCAQSWPPVTGPATASGVTGTFATITRSDGSVQATFDGHPLYTFAGDTAPGQNNGNGLNTAGGLWHEVTTSGTAQASSSSSGSGGGGY